MSNQFIKEIYYRSTLIIDTDKEEERISFFNDNLLNRICVMSDPSRYQLAFFNVFIEKLAEISEKIRSTVEEILNEFQKDNYQYCVWAYNPDLKLPDDLESEWSLSLTLNTDLFLNDKLKLVFYFTGWEIKSHRITSGDTIEGGTWLSPFDNKQQEEFENKRVINNLIEKLSLIHSQTQPIPLKVRIEELVLN